MRILLSLMLASLWLASARGEDRPAQNLVVHEWGTFTGISGSDGTPLHFRASLNDLPSFVHANGFRLKSYEESSVSLETPVTYFYAREAMDVKVKAEFPQGRFTEWYPAAAVTRDAGTAVIEWPTVKILPGQKADLRKEDGPGRYYHARAANANLLRVASGERFEHETFLFYRGTGLMALPLKAAFSSAVTVKVSNQGSHPISAAFLVRVHGKKLSFERCAALEAGASAQVSLASAKEGVDTLSETLVKTLAAEGLYEKEARAMVATWRDAWLEEEGARVLYILPTKATGAFLPLTVAPVPDETVRVMVGRQDLFTPEQEAEFKRLYADLSQGSPETREQATKAFQALGRFKDAAIERARALDKPRP
ncbi:MAG: hypothetical protein KIS92_18760 [Planctomycetota bacterium]|nr:hypothetical protein [Planctomycetota bacterium]